MFSYCNKNILILKNHCVRCEKVIKVGMNYEAKMPMALWHKPNDEIETLGIGCVIV